jgi:HAD superfamily hydrolase (TIGR01549 family)
MKRILITDLDDTLYSWMNFFIPAFEAMLDSVAEITGISREILKKEYREINIKYGTVERPYTTLELPSIKRLYNDCSDEEIKSILGEAFHQFNSVRKHRLELYPGVYDTLKTLANNNIIIIGYTDSAEENGLYRLKKMGVDQFFKFVYSADSSYNHMIKECKSKTVKTKKPDKDILLKICEDEHCDASQVVYVGDSLTKDIYMALQANITSVWAQCGEIDKSQYSTLVEISSWTDEDFMNEKYLKDLWNENGYKPDYTIHNFEEVLTIFDLSID